MLFETLDLAPRAVAAENLSTVTDEGKIANCRRNVGDRYKVYVWAGTTMYGHVTRYYVLDRETGVIKWTTDKFRTLDGIVKQLSGDLTHQTKKEETDEPFYLRGILPPSPM